MSDSVRPHRWQPTRLRRPWDSPSKNAGVGCHFLLQSMKVKGESEVTRSCLTLRDPMDCSPPGSSVLGISQAGILEWEAIPFSRGLPDPGIEPRSPALAGGFFTTETSGKPNTDIFFCLIWWFCVCVCVCVCQSEIVWTLFRRFERDKG